MMRIIMPQKHKVVGQQRVFQKKYDEDWVEIDLSKASIDTEAINKIVEEFVEAKIGNHKEEEKPWDVIEMSERVEELTKMTWTELKKMYKKLWWPIDVSKVVNKRRLANLIIQQENASKEED